MKLIGILTSPYVRKTRIVLIEKKIDYEFVVTDLNSPDNIANQFNPLGKVPCLVMDDGKALYDSSVIVDYLDTTTPVSAPMTSKRPIITGAGTLSPSLMATQEITQPANMKMPSPARLNLFTAYMKQKQSPVKVNGIARLMILPTLLTDENGPSTNCWII